MRRRWPGRREYTAEMLIALPQRSRSALSAALLAAMLLVAAALPAQAQWQWRDKNGQITVSDLPPPRDVPEKDILKRPGPSGAAASKAPAAPVTAASAPAAPANPARPAGDKELEARKRAAEQEQQARARADEERLAQQRAENCNRARAHLASLDSGARIARANAKGELEVLDDKGRADERRRAGEVVASDCK
jgi:hypothetical protein